MALDNKIVYFDIDKMNLINLKAKQNDTDNARSITLKLLKDSKPFDLKGLTVKVGGKKADNTNILNDCTVTDARNGIVQVDLSTQMLAVHGLLSLELIFLNGSTRLSTIPFEVQVIQSVTDFNAVQSSDEFGSLVASLNISSEYATKLKEGTEKIELQYADKLNDVSAKLSETVIVCNLNKDGTATQSDIQAFFNNIPNNSTVLICDSIFNLSDVILIENKENVKIINRNTKYKVTKHGYGAIEISNCTRVSFLGSECEGYGNFPPLDKDFNGEKQKYKSDWGYYKNGDKTTSPAYGGGHEGNCGIGILIHNNCNDILIEGNKCHNFNYSGISVGWLNDNEISSNIKIKGNICTENYNDGIGCCMVNGAIIDEKNICNNNGHTKATVNDTLLDPGYGITLRRTSDTNKIAKGVTISNNQANSNKRKGIDAHSGDNIRVYSNDVADNLVQGIAFTNLDNTLSNVSTYDNNLKNNGRAKNINDDAGAGILSSAPNTKIYKNTIQDSGYVYGIFINNANITVDDNTIINSNEDVSEYNTGICSQGAFLGQSIINNKINGKFKRGITLSKDNKCKLYGNDTNLSGDNYDELFIDTQCNALIGENSFKNLVSLAKNKGTNPFVELQYIVEFNGTVSPTITPMITNSKITYTTGASGSGFFLRFNIGSIAKEVLPYCIVELSYCSKYADIIKYLYPIATVSSGSYLDAILSLRDINGNVLPVDNSDINNTKIKLKLKLPIQ